MSLSTPFIDRPVATTLMTIAITLSGILGYGMLPVSSLPQVDYPSIGVNASLPGASPETMASAVATPLERAFSAIAGVESMASTSTTGRSRVVLQFRLERNIDGAAQDVQSAISSALRRLPAELPTPPSFRKVNPADQPILFLVVTSPTTRNRIGDRKSVV